MSPPDWAWALESVTFKVAIPIGGRHVSLNFWSADKYSDVQCRQTERGIELVVPGNGTTIVPMSSVATIRDKRIAAPAMTPPPADAWPVEEVTPTAPPEASVEVQPTRSVGAQSWSRYAISTPTIDDYFGCTVIRKRVTDRLWTSHTF